jgi:hypothetical protein
MLIFEFDRVNPVVERKTLLNFIGNPNKERIRRFRMVILIHQ